MGVSYFSLVSEALPRIDYHSLEFHWQMLCLLEMSALVPFQERRRGVYVIITLAKGVWWASAPS